MSCLDCLLLNSSNSLLSSIFSMGNFMPMSENKLHWHVCMYVCTYVRMGHLCICHFGCGNKYLSLHFIASFYGVKFCILFHYLFFPLHVYAISLAVFFFFLGLQMTSMCCHLEYFNDYFLNCSFRQMLTWMWLNTSSFISIPFHCFRALCRNGEVFTVCIIFRRIKHILNTRIINRVFLIFLHLTDYTIEECCLIWKINVILKKKKKARWCSNIFRVYDYCAVCACYLFLWMLDFL